MINPSPNETLFYLRIHVLKGELMNRASLVIIWLDFDIFGMQVVDPAPLIPH